MHQPQILLVDDDENILALYRLALKRKPDWKLFSASDGAHTLQLLAEQQLDFVVLDVMLPDIDGIEICRRLRLLAHLATVPVVMFSASNDSAIKREARAAGANDFWEKPVSPAEFVSRIERWLNLAPVT